jgi:hypothetical protein
MNLRPLHRTLRSHLPRTLNVETVAFSIFGSSLAFRHTRVLDDVELGVIDNPV